MDVSAIQFKKDEPNRVTVDMSIEEAAFLCKLIGTMPGTDLEKVFRDGSRMGHEIWNCLTGMVFNPYYSNGVDEYLAHKREG